MKTMTETMTYAATEVIPAATLADCGEIAMQREFSDLVRSAHSNATVSGWIVTLTVRHDGSDTAFLRNRMIEQLAALPAKSINAFS